MSYEGCNRKREIFGSPQNLLRIVVGKNWEAEANGRPVRGVAPEVL
jgi:hypothetical protein